MIYSYTEVSADWPADMELAKAPETAFARVWFEGDRACGEWSDGTGYADGVLREVIEMFGMPLDEVPGLRLHCHWDTAEVDDGYLGCELTIADGECRYKESYVGWADRPMDDCPFDIGR